VPLQGIYSEAHFVLANMMLNAGHTINVQWLTICTVV